jgi:tRNA(His) guanylyltransferase
MEFERFDTSMRLYETANDLRIVPNMWVVARLDGRNFTRLLHETHPFEPPFDQRVRDLMLDTTEHLMQCGFRVVYGWTASDEISLLMHPQDDSFERKERKWISILAGEASAVFSFKLGGIASFDCRLSQLPSNELVCDYFRWRSTDAHRNALNAHCYWLLRSQGVAPQQAAKQLIGLSIADKNELLFRHGINFNDLPAWQKRGAGVLWQQYEKRGLNPQTGTEQIGVRRRLHRELQLPMKKAYATWLADQVLR